MRRTFLLLIAASICTAVPIAAQSSNQTHRARDAILEQWTRSLNSEDTDGFLNCYWDDAVRFVYFPGSEPEITEGMEELRRAEAESMEKYDYSSMNLVYDEPVRLFPQESGPTYIYANSQLGFMDVFEFERRGGEYRIVRQYLFPHPRAE